MNGKPNHEPSILKVAGGVFLGLLAFLILIIALIANWQDVVSFLAGLGIR